MRLNKDISFHVKPDLGIRHDYHIVGHV